MADLVLPTIQRMLDVLIARVIGSSGLQGLNTSTGDETWKTCNAFTRRARAILVDFAGFAVNMIPSTATGIWLRRWANTYLETPLLVATKWTGTITLHCEAGYTPNEPLTGATLTAPDGVQYITTADVHDYDWTSEQATVAAEAVVAGTAANQATGTTLTLDSPPANVLAQAEIASTTTTARDDEKDPHLRARIGVETKYKPGAGNEAHYRAWALEVDGVTDCAVYPRWDGDTTVTLVSVGLLGARAVTAAVRAAVLAKVQGERPMNITPTVENWAYAGPIAIGVTVKPKPGYEPDWNQSFHVHVSSVSPDLKTIYLDADPTGSIAIGNRVVGKPTSVYVEQRIVDAVYPAPTNAIRVTEPFTAAPAPGTHILPGGPLWQPIYDAVKDIEGELGPSASSTAGKARHPPLESGELPPHLRLSDLYACVEALAGTESCIFTAPTGDELNAVAAAAAITILYLGPLTVTWG